MGGAMVEAILADGYRVWVYDIDAAAASALEPLGAQEAPGPGALAAQADVILTSLPDARAVRAVYLGEEGLVSGPRPGTVLVELSTIDPATIEELERVVSERGAVLLDVPVSGSPDEARRGELVLTAGGEREALAAVEPILKCFGRTIQYVGPAGAAKIVKIVNDMMTMGNVLVAAEAFCVGVKAGIAPDLLFEVLSGSGGRSHHFTKRFPNALAGDFKPGFSVALGEKDLGLALELSEPGHAFAHDRLGAPDVPDRHVGGTLLGGYRRRYKALREMERGPSPRRGSSGGQRWRPRGRGGWRGAKFDDGAASSDRGQAERRPRRGLERQVVQSDAEVGVRRALVGLPRSRWACPAGRRRRLIPRSSGSYPGKQRRLAARSPRVTRRSAPGVPAQALDFRWRRCGHANAVENDLASRRSSCRGGAGRLTCPTPP